MKRVISVALSALVAIFLGVACEWVLLTGSTPYAVASAVAQSRPAPVVHYARPDFQTGVVFARWGTNAYTSTDPNWAIGLSEIQQQTAARWIEVTVNFFQPASTSTQVEVSRITPGVASLAEGIRTAKARGYHVFVVPEITVAQVGWSGLIHFSTPEDTAAWFQHYWQVLKPYLQAASAAGADQFSLGTEYQTLEFAAPALWNQLIEEAHAVFAGALTYDVNFTSLSDPLHAWMLNPDLTYIGVSEYQPLTHYSQWLDPSILPDLWNTEILSGLDQFAARLGKPVVLSEIGYRNSADALYNPWQSFSKSPPDPTEQAAAYNAALTNVIGDPYIAGIYFWGWSIPVFQPNWQPAAKVLRQWYTSPQS
ncbi:MAG TPA: hypothetical protein VGN32_01655 [Ktedonobacterales bacterium]|nr:hypothetical protein [Ktedonobacterales bacterium]